MSEAEWKQFYHAEKTGKSCSENRNLMSQKIAISLPKMLFF
jgi:hypothetical protein